MYHLFAVDVILPVPSGTGWVLPVIGGMCVILIARWVRSWFF